MAHVTIPDEQNWVSFSDPQSTGPFSFSFTVFGKADLRVFVGGTEKAQGDFSFTGNAGAEGGHDGGQITLNSASGAGDDVLILRDVTPARATDISSGPISANDLNDEFDVLTAGLADVRFSVQRAFLIPVGESAPDLPSISGETDVVLALDSNGNPEWAAKTDITAAVTSFEGRTGAITAQSDDYSADQITYTPAGNLAATDAEGAINELDSEKQAVSEKGQANGYAGLDGNGEVPQAQLPSAALASAEADLALMMVL